MGYKKMNPQIKRQWLEALRSGNYRQVRGRLRRQRSTKSYGYCCLGVLSNIVDPKAWQPADFLSSSYAGRIQHGRETRMISRSVRERCGLGSYEASRLAHLNDHGSVKGRGVSETGKNFNQIADWIESNL